MPWQISEFGQTWTTEELTVAEAETLEEEFGCSWLNINPFVSIRHFRAVLVTFLSRTMDRAAATEKVRALEIRDLAEHIVNVEDNRPVMWEDGSPKAEGSALTDGSSSVPSGSDGLPT